MTSVIETDYRLAEASVAELAGGVTTTVYTVKENPLEKALDGTHSRLLDLLFACLFTASTM